VSEKRETKDNPQGVRFVDAALTITEDVVYAGIALLLGIASAGLLYVAARDLLDTFGDRNTEGVLHVLDTLLLVFIFVELLYAVRETLRERQVLVEPFLLVGILAAIKELVILSVEAAGQATDNGPAFDRSVVEIAVLGALIVGLAVSAVLLRRKEREPQEASD